MILTIKKYMLLLLMVVFCGGCVQEEADLTLLLACSFRDISSNSIAVKSPTPPTVGTLTIDPCKRILAQPSQKKLNTVRCASHDDKYDIDDGKLYIAKHRDGLLPLGNNIQCSYLGDMNCLCTIEEDRTNRKITKGFINFKVEYSCNTLHNTKGKYTTSCKLPDQE